MKNKLLFCALLLICSSGCRAEEVSFLRQVAQTLSSVVTIRPMDYRLVMLHIPMDVSIDQIATGDSFKALAPFQVTVSVAVWSKQIKELLDILATTKLQKTDLRGDYRWGIQIVAAWDQKPMALYWDENRSLAEINGSCYHLDGQLNEWIRRYAAPVMASMQRGKP